MPALGEARPTPPHRRMAMHRDSKQRSKPGTRTSQATGGIPSPMATEAEPKASARKRRRSRVDLKSARTPADAPAPKPGRAAVSPAAKPALHAKRPGMGALDAAAQILTGLSGEEAKQGIKAQTLIDRMAKQKLWTSPGGKTPQATLYAAMVREITSKGAAARFRKVSRGHFTAATNAAPASRRKAKA